MFITIYAHMHNNDWLRYSQKNSSTVKLENNALFMDYKPLASVTKYPLVSQPTCHNAQMVKITAVTPV